MRPILFLPLILLGTSAASLPHHQDDRVAVHIALDDLALDQAADRAVLRKRIAAAARDYCRAHGQKITPQLIRTEAGYCRDTMRQSIFAQMSREVRRAVAQADKEAR